MKQCPFCAEDIQDAAIVCKHCGRDLHPPAAVPTAAPMAAKAGGRRILKVIAALAVGIVGLVVLFVALILANIPTSPRSTSVEPSKTIRAADLYEEYEKNEVAADRQFKGEMLLITGRVKDIGKDFTGAPYLILGENPDNPFGTQAMFARDESSSLAALTKGDRVKAACVVDGKVLTNVLVRQCTLK